MRKTPWMFCEAAGVYWNGKTKPLWEVAVNLVVSLILVKTIGIAGVFIGTIVAILVVDLPVEPHLVSKYVLKGGIAKYYIQYIKYFIVTAIMYTASYFACSLLPESIGGFGGIIPFILRAIVSVIVTNLIIVITMYRTNEFKYTTDLIKKMFGSLKNKIKAKKGEE